MQHAAGVSSSLYTLPTLIFQPNGGDQFRGASRPLEMTNVPQKLLYVAGYNIGRVSQ